MSRKDGPCARQILRAVPAAAIPAARSSRTARCRGSVPPLPRKENANSCCRASHHRRANHKSQSKRRADESEWFRALFRFRDVGDVSKSRRHVRRRDAGNEAPDKKPAQRWRHRHKNIVDAQAEARNQNHRTAAKPIRPMRQAAVKKQIAWSPTQIRNSR